MAGTAPAVDTAGTPADPSPPAAHARRKTRQSSQTSLRPTAFPQEFLQNGRSAGSTPVPQPALLPQRGHTPAGAGVRDAEIPARTAPSHAAKTSSLLRIRVRDR